MYNIFNSLKVILQLIVVRINVNVTRMKSNNISDDQLNVNLLLQFNYFFKSLILTNYDAALF